MSTGDVVILREEVAPKRASQHTERCTELSPQHHKNAAVGQVCPADEMVDAIHQQRARRLKEDLVIIGIELADRKSYRRCGWP